MTPGLSIRRNFAWNFAGNVLYNLAQWLLVLALAHLADATVVGRFSLSLAIAAPVFLTIGMNLRNAQATDAARRFHLRDYLALRHLVNVVAALASVAVGVVLGLRGAELLVIVGIAVAKAVEGLSQTYYGYFQQRHRLDLVSRSMLWRSVAGPALFLAAFLATHQLAVAALGLAVGWGSVQVLLDRPNARRIHRGDTGTDVPPLRPVAWPAVRALARRSSPLGVDAGISSLALNVPRYAVQTVLGTAHLGVFASIAYLGQTVSMVTSSMQAVVLPRLAVFHHEGRRRAFVRLIARLALFGLAVTSVGVVGAMLLGRQFLELVLPTEYVRPDLLVVLMVGAGLTTLQRCLCKGVEAAQRFRAYVVIDTVTTASIAVAAWPFTAAWGLMGAAWSLSVGFAVGIIVAGVVLARVVAAMPTTPPRATARGQASPR